MSRMLSKMNLISVVQQLPNDDIETIQGYVEMIEEENQQLQERIEYLERSNNRREDTILEQRQEISDLEDNWNKLKEKVNEGMRTYRNKNYDLVFDIEEIPKEDLNDFISYLALQVMEQLILNIEQGEE